MLAPPPKRPTPNLQPQPQNATNKLNALNVGYMLDTSSSGTGAPSAAWCTRRSSCRG